MEKAEIKNKMAEQAKSLEEAKKKAFLTSDDVVKGIEAAEAKKPVLVKDTKKGFVTADAKKAAAKKLAKS